VPRRNIIQTLCQGAAAVGGLFAIWWCFKQLMSPAPEPFLGFQATQGLEAQVVVLVGVIAISTIALYVIFEYALCSWSRMCPDCKNRIGD
jgi:hypothetical protein